MRIADHGRTDPVGQVSETGRLACAGTRAARLLAMSRALAAPTREGAAGAWGWLAEKWETATPEANANATMGSQRARKAGEWRGFSAEERERSSVLAWNTFEASRQPRPGAGRRQAASQGLFRCSSVWISSRNARGGTSPMAVSHHFPCAPTAHAWLPKPRGSPSDGRSGEKVPQTPTL